MAAIGGGRTGAELSKAEYLKRYLSGPEDPAKSKGKVKKKRKKPTETRLKIVDDDIDWRQMVQQQAEAEEEEDEDPVIAEFIDDRPEEVKQMEAFKSNRWKKIGDDDEDRDPEQMDPEGSRQSSQDSIELSIKQERSSSPVRKTRHDSPDISPRRRGRHDSPDASPPRKVRHDSPDVSPPRKVRHDSPDVSPARRRRDFPDASPPRKVRYDSPDVSPARRGRRDSPNVSHQKHRSEKLVKMRSKDSSPTRRKSGSSSQSRHRSSDHRRSPPTQKNRVRQDSDSDQSPPRKKAIKQEPSDSDQSPPRRSSRSRNRSDSDQSPPRRKSRKETGSDGDLSPPRRQSQSHSQRMLSGGKAGLISVEILREEQKENRRREKNNQPLEDESRNAETIFRDKSGKKRDLASEREEQKRKAGEKAAKDEKYAQWGKGLAQNQMRQQQLEDALHEAQKPLARHRDDEDLDRMLREQEREGDPMAAMLRRKKEKSSKTQDKPRYTGPPPPPNRFNIPPGYRWDGVDRSNGFEKKRYTRLADKKAVQEAAYKWSVEDM